MNKIIIWIIVVAAVFLSTAFGFWARNQKMAEKNGENSLKILKIGKTALNIEVAETNTERERGLSGRASLGQNEGLLFVFDAEGYYGIWMKGMNFSIDIAWLDKNKKIIYAEENVLPKTYPEIFNSPAPSLYILETSAGFFKNYGIKIGDVAEF